jgi:hypothetical protein
MAGSARRRLELVPVDAEAMTLVAELVGADPEGRAEFGGFYGRAPDRLAPLLGPLRHAWLLRLDGRGVGFLDADLVDATVSLVSFVISDSRRLGIASAAVGRFLGMRVWPDAAHCRAVIGADNVASRGVLVRTGFAITGLRDVGDEIWERRLPSAPREGIERYLRADGRIDRYPSSNSERLALLTWIIGRALPSGVVVNESRINELLEPYSDDVAVLRRYLVDHELVERTTSGSEYARVRSHRP